MATETELLKGSEIADLLPATETGERLSRGECVRLWETHDLTTLGILANLRREAVSGNKSFYRSAFHLNPTLHSVPACRLCDRLAGPNRNTLAPEEVETILEGLDDDAVGELHVAGGPDRELGIGHLTAWVRCALRLRPKMKLRAFTWDLLEMVAAKDGENPARVLKTLLDTGLTALVGGALIDLGPERRHIVRGAAEEMKRRLGWLEAAADLSLKAEVSWVFGDGDDSETLVETLAVLRDMQDRFGIFECFTPLLFHSSTEDLDLPMPTGYNQLRAVAVGRLFLDNFSRIRAPWSALSESIMQVAQWYGADDAGCVILPTRNAPAGGFAGDMRRERLEELLRATGRDPVDG
jgi:aminodeoxyfutalosine synthase